jgi:hypothetical protein
MTRLPLSEQWVLHRMSEIEVAEMIEEHINFVDKNGRCVHLPMDFVRHYVRRDDDALPTVVAIATAPIVLADGGLLAPDGLDRDRGIIFIVQRELRAAVPNPEHCGDFSVRAAIQFLSDEWLCDVATDFVGKCTIIAAALTIIERSLLPDRPVFFITAGRWGGGKTTTLTMLIMALTGIWPAAWSSNEEERRKALLSKLHHLGQHPAWYTDQLSPCREELHGCLLLRSKARRQRGSRDRRFNYSLFHRE